jgi:broad specificity phosphatase PhoE
MATSCFIARHGETVFNAASRMQGATLHTPLTRSGFAQAEAMGEALRQRLGARPAIELWASPTGRALQTLAVICEHLELDWHAAKTDARLAEIDVGAWGGLYYRDIVAQAGDFVDREAMLFSRRPPGGEWYDGIAERLRSWIGEQAPSGARLLVMHDMSSRVLRGLLTGREHRPECGAPIADRLPQGSVVEIADSVETRLGFGAGGSS